jgi:hypothetical protein
MKNKQLERTTGGIFLSILCVIGLAIAVKLAAIGMSSLHDDQPIEPLSPLLLQPSPVRLPGDVVRLQLDALRQSSDLAPDAGLELVYNFVSPAAKQNAPTLGQFIAQFNDASYQGLLHHRDAFMGAVEIKGDKARSPVVVRSNSNQEAGYVFVLSRQTDGEFKDCWLTDRIFRFR